MPAAVPDTGLEQGPGSRHYRAWVGAPQTYDLFSHMQFSLMTLLGLRQDHALLDIGCGSLRGGKLFLVYLLPDRYHGIEPEEWLVKEGLDRELGEEIVRAKRPRFRYSADFPCGDFGVKFDYVLAQSIFSHASVAQIGKCLREVRAAMKPEAIFAASFLEGEVDHAGDSWVYPGCVRYRASTIERLAADAGLACRRLDWFHSGGQAWFIFFQPGLEPEVELVASLNSAAMLRIEMSHYRARSERLERIESHPLFRLATRLYRLTGKLLGR
jgi:hypothetical protein